MGTKKLTYQEISRKSGISMSTISRVFNKSNLVTSGTRKKVLEALSSMGLEVNSADFTPDIPGRFIIFNVPTIKNPYYSPIIDSSRIVAERNGYTLLLNVNPLNDDRSISNFLELMKATRCSGVILANSVTKEEIEKICANVPCVTCSEYIDDSTVPFVTIDNKEAARKATEHLISIGKKKIAFLNGPRTFKYARDREKGYISALREHDIRVDNSIIGQVGADMDFDMAKASAHYMLSSQFPPDAFFCISDVLAAAVVKVAIELGFRIPEDVAVVGFDNIFVSSIVSPGITTISQPVSQLGSIASDMLIKLIEKREERISPIYLKSELIIRESTIGKEG